MRRRYEVPRAVFASVALLAGAQLIAARALAAGAPDPPPGGFCAPGNANEVVASFIVPTNYFSCTKGTGRIKGLAKMMGVAGDAGCYVVTTGMPLDCSICAANWAEEPTAGHAHDTSRKIRPLLYDRGSLWSSLNPNKSPVDSDGFFGRTNYGWYVGMYLYPEAAAVVRHSVWAKLHSEGYRFLCAPHDPDGWPMICLGNDLRQAYTEIRLMHLPAYLVELPPSQHYIRCDYSELCEGPEDSQGHRKHGYNMYVRPDVAPQIERLAYSFRTYQPKGAQGFPYLRYRLRITEASLVHGGLFDIKGDWSPPHCRHRLGTSVDIGRKVFDTQTGQVHTLDDKEKKALQKRCGEIIFNLRIIKVAGRWELVFDTLHCEWEQLGTPLEHLHVEVHHCLKGECAPFPKNTLSLNSTCPWFAIHRIVIGGEEPKPCPYQGQLP